MASTEEVFPSEVRARILEEHASLRAHMRSLAREAAAPGGDVRGEIDRLLAALHRVLEIEHDLLLPTLRTIDAWGQERARRLSAWHLDVRERVETLERDAVDRSPEELAARARAFLDALRDDLRSEERTHLSSELLRELPMPTDLGGA